MEKVRTNTWWKWAGLGCWLLALGCGKGEGPEVIARVGGRPITGEDFREAVRKVMGEERGVADMDSAARRELLDALIAARLLGLEGEKRGLGQDETVREGLAALERRLLREEIYRRDIWGQVEIREADLRRKFAEWGAGEQIQAAHILCRTQAAADEVLEALGKGTRFDSLARQRSRHAASAPRGGSMGFMRRNGLIPEIREAVWELPAGQVFPAPIQTSMGYHVVKVLGRRRQSLEEQRPALERRLESEKKAEKERIFWNQLRQEYGLQWNPEIAALMAQRKELPEEQVLFRWKGGRLSAADYVRRAGVAQPVFRDTIRIHRLAEGLAMMELIRLEALKRGYGRLESVRRSLARKREELMGKRLFELEVGGRQIPVQQLRDFYEGNLDKYRDHTRVSIREILVDARSRADSLHALIQNGAAMGELARRFTLRSTLKGREGIWEDVEPGDPRSAKIYRVALEGEGLLPPVKVPGGYSVIQVLEKKKGRLLGFAEVEKSVREDVAAVKMDAFIHSLRRRYEEEISIDEIDSAIMR